MYSITLVVFLRDFPMLLLVEWKILDIRNSKAILLIRCDHIWMVCFVNDICIDKVEKMAETKTLFSMLSSIRTFSLLQFVHVMQCKKKVISVVAILHIYNKFMPTCLLYIRRFFLTSFFFVFSSLAHDLFCYLQLFCLFQFDT